MDINEATLFGTIKEISQIFTLKNGQKCCWLSISTDVSYEKRDGTLGSDQNNHRVITYGRYAQVIKEKASINQRIFIQGRLKASSWSYHGTFFEKEFIVLERFKLYPLQDEPQEQDYEPFFEEDDYLNNDLEDESYDDNHDYEDFLDRVDLLAHSDETGWYYPDYEPEDNDK